MLKILRSGDELVLDMDMVKMALDISLHDSTYDKLIEHMIRAATVKVEEHVQRSITDTTWEYTHSHHVLHLPRPKIQKIISVHSNGVELQPSEYKKSFASESIVVILDQKYMDNENTVIYEAGFGGKQNIPLTLSNVIFETAVEMFKEGVGLNESTHERMKAALDNTGFSPRVRILERVGMFVN